MRRAALWLVALLSLVISGLAYAVGFLAGLIVAGLAAGYAWGWETVQPRTVVIVEDEDD
jgi:hypothetical protein